MEGGPVTQGAGVDGAVGEFQRHEGRVDGDRLRQGETARDGERDLLLAAHELVDRRDQAIFVRHPGRAELQHVVDAQDLHRIDVLHAPRRSCRLGRSVRHSAQAQGAEDASREHIPARM
jgi:hypothetical protein